jgi:Ca2+-transporting ATPase
MLGMTSIRKSFVHNFFSKNWLLWLSFVLGILLQVAVVNIPGLNSFFSCSPLDFAHWGIVLALAVAPLVVHEIVVLVLFITRKVQK